MIRRPPRSTQGRTLFPYTTLFRSLVHRTGDDGVHVARERQANRFGHRIPSDLPGLLGEQGARSRERELHVFPAPCSLLPAPYEGEIRVKRTEGERLVDHLRPDPPRIAECDRESGAAARTGRRRTWCDAASRDGA